MGGSEMRKFEKDYIMLASEILQRGIEVPSFVVLKQKNRHLSQCL